MGSVPIGGVMRSFWSDPYLWVHLAGIAAVPLLLEISLLGLAVGDPILPFWLELGLVGAIGILPILWMQWQRPFSIFSLLFLALKPNQLNETQRRILRMFKDPITRILAILTAIFLAWVLWQLYAIAPIAYSVTPLQTKGRWLGLLVAAIAFLAANLFLQVPVSVARVLWVNESRFAALEPYPFEQIPRDFTLLGLRVKRILPPLSTAPVKLEPPPASIPVPRPPVPEPTEAPAELAETPVAETPAVPAADLPSDAGLETPPTEVPSAAPEVVTPDSEADAEIAVDLTAEEIALIQAMEAEVLAQEEAIAAAEAEGSDTHSETTANWAAPEEAAASVDSKTLAEPEIESEIEEIAVEAGEAEPEFEAESVAIVPEVADEGETEKAAIEPSESEVVIEIIKLAEEPTDPETHEEGES